MRRGREHNLALWKAEKPLVLGPSLLLEKHPAYLAFCFVELGECRAVDSEAVMDVTGDDIAFMDVSAVYHYSLYVDVTTGRTYADDSNPCSDHAYQFMSGEFLVPEVREKVDIVVAAIKSNCPEMTLATAW